MTLDHTDAGELENLSASLRGPLIYPSDDNYDEARRVYNAMNDRRPSLIVQATDIADVMATVNFARGTRSRFGDTRWRALGARFRHLR